MKKIYILVMVLLVYAASAFTSAFAAENDAQYEYLTGNETDVAATGEYEGITDVQSKRQWLHCHPFPMVSSINQRRKQ